MARPVPLAFNLVPMCICLYLLIECLCEKTLALLLFSRFSLFTLLICLMKPAIVSGRKRYNPLDIHLFFF
jgi:hypothetical protein